MVNGEFMNSDIASQVLLMNASERAQEIAKASPTTFIGITMDFANTVTIIISRPLVEAMANGMAHAFQVVVAVIFVGIHRCFWLSELLNERT